MAKSNDISTSSKGAKCIEIEETSSSRDKVIDISNTGDKVIETSVSEEKVIETPQNSSGGTTNTSNPSSFKSTYCPNCGKKYYQSYSRYCTQCGQKRK